MKFFKRNSQKEYDGPAANAPVYRRHSTGASAGDQSGQVPKSVISNNGIVWSVGSSISSNKLSRRSSDHISDSSKLESKSGESSRSRSNSSSTSKSTKIDRSIPLASGISSKRTHIPIDKHVAAKEMSAYKHNQHPMQPISEGGQSSNPTVCNVSTSDMHHDGGITCLLPLPSTHNSYQFLSGGVDGTIQLWNIPHHPTGDIRDKEKLLPQWVRTYKGHRGYIHQLARLGWFDPKKKREQFDSEVSFNSKRGTAPSLDDKEKKRRKELFVSASQDNTLRIWELDGDYCDENTSVGSHSTSSTTVHTNSLSSKGKKLRGHVFGGPSDSVTSQGVLCVCSVPSLTPRGDISFDRADQFVSGGADGIVRVWDVRTALSLDKVPKSGLYSTVQIQCIEKEKLSVLDDTGESDCESEGEEGAIKPKRSKKRSQADPITSLVCTGNSLGTVALFAADSKGTIRRYSPKNKNSMGYTNSIWWEFTGYFTSSSAPISSLAILKSPELSRLVYSDYATQKDVTLLASASSGSIRVWDGSDVLIRKKLDASDTHYSSVDRKKIKREELWKIQLNNDEDSGDDEESSTAKSSLFKNRIGITSLSTCQGRRLIAGANDGKIHIWDVSSGEYEGSYEFGQSIQIWSLSVVHEAEYEVGDEIISVGIIVSGDNCGRLRAVKNVSSQYIDGNLLDQAIQDKQKSSQVAQEVVGDQFQL
jgi:WD40 repeat protein